MLAELGDDVARDLRPVGLEARGVNAVIPDEGIGLAEDLTPVARIGDGFRIADDPGIENDFPPGLDVRAETYALEDGPVRKGQRRSANVVGLPSIFGAV